MEYTTKDSKEVGAQLYSLSNADFIMAFRGRTPERLENLYTILRHFELTYTDYRILLIEADTEPRFNPKLRPNPNLIHTFIHDDGAFPKAMLYNYGAKLSHKSVIVFNDVDCITMPDVLAGAIKDMSLDENSNIVYCPFEQCYDISGALKRRFVAHPVLSELPSNLSEEGNQPEGVKYLLSLSDGGINIMRREQFIRCGGFHPEMRGWGYEDSEFHSRTERMGMQWLNIAGSPLFHLNHDSKDRIDLENLTGEVLAQRPDFAKNRDMLWGAKHMPIEELHALVGKFRQFYI